MELAIIHIAFYEKKKRLGFTGSVRERDKLISRFQ